MAESKQITLGQLKKLALRGKANSDALIAELAELVATGFEDVQHVGIVVTLPANQWTTDGTQTISHAAFLASSEYWYLVLGDVSVGMDDITVNGQATFRHAPTPVEDLTVYIIRLGVEL